MILRNQRNHMACDSSIYSKGYCGDTAGNGVDGLGLQQIPKTATVCACDTTCTNTANCKGFDYDPDSKSCYLKTAACMGTNKDPAGSSFMNSSPKNPCSPTQCGKTFTRTVTCVDEQGTTVDDSMCSATKPLASMTCTACPSWVVGQWK